MTWILKGRPAALSEGRLSEGLRCTKNRTEKKKKNIGHIAQIRTTSIWHCQWVTILMHLLLHKCQMLNIWSMTTTYSCWNAYAQGEVLYFNALTMNVVASQIVQLGCFVSSYHIIYYQTPVPRIGGVQQLKQGHTGVTLKILLGGGRGGHYGKLVVTFDTSYSPRTPVCGPHMAFHLLQREGRSFKQSLSRRHAADPTLLLSVSQ